MESSAAYVITVSHINNAVEALKLAVNAAQTLLDDYIRNSLLDAFERSIDTLQEASLGFNVTMPAIDLNLSTSGIEQTNQTLALLSGMRSSLAERKHAELSALRTLQRILDERACSISFLQNSSTMIVNDVSRDASLIQCRREQARVEIEIIQVQRVLLLADRVSGVNTTNVADSACPENKHESVFGESPSPLTEFNALHDCVTDYDDSDDYSSGHYDCTGMAAYSSPAPLCDESMATSEPSALAVTNDLFSPFQPTGPVIAEVLSGVNGLPVPGLSVLVDSLHVELHSTSEYKASLKRTPLDALLNRMVAGSSISRSPLQAMPSQTSASTTQPIACVPVSKSKVKISQQCYESQRPVCDENFVDTGNKKMPPPFETPAKHIPGRQLLFDSPGLSPIL